MANGSFELAKSNVSSGGSYIIGKIVWSSTANTVGNNSSVTATLYCKKANDYTQLTVATSGSWAYSLTVNGVTTTTTAHKSILADWVEIASKTVSVNHGSDGKKSITISGSVTAPSGTSFAGMTTSGSQTVALDLIPRTSSVSATTANIGSATKIIIGRATPEFTHTLTYRFGSLSGTIETKTANTSVEWTIPTTFYSQIPNSPSGYGVITCTTYIGDVSIGSSTCEFWAIADKAICAPSVSVSAADVNNESIALSGSNKTIISGISNLKVVTTAKANNSATIEAITVYCGSDKKTGADVTFFGASSKDVYAIVTDSRGYSTRVDCTALSVINYIIPTIIPSITRDTPTGDTVTVSLRGKWYNGSFRSVANFLQLSVKYKGANEEDYGSYYSLPVSVNGNDYNATLSLTGLDYRHAFSFVIRLEDAVFTAANGYRDAKLVTVPLSKGVPVFDWGEDDFCFNVPVKIQDQWIADFVVEQGTDGMWTYRKWQSGIAEAWGETTVTVATQTAYGNGFYSGNVMSVDLPYGLFTARPQATICVFNTSDAQIYFASLSVARVATLHYSIASTKSNASANIDVSFRVSGKWK